MFEFLLYTNMMCSDADALIIGIKKNRSELAPHIVVELVETVKESVPECEFYWDCLLYTSPSPRDLSTSRMPSSA